MKKLVYLILAIMLIASITLVAVSQEEAGTTPTAAADISPTEPDPTTSPTPTPTPATNYGAGYLPGLPGETHTLEVIISPPAAGTVDLFPNGMGIYGEGQSVDLTAQAGGDYSFSNWSGDMGGNTNPDTIIMDSDKVVTANFALPGQEPDAGEEGAEGDEDAGEGEGGAGAPQGNLPIDDQGITTGGVAISGQCQDCSGVLVIPEGTAALDASGGPLDNITVDVPATTPPDPPNGTILGICDFGPEGATFDPAITVKMNFDPADIPDGVAQEDLTLAWYDEGLGQWTGLDNIQAGTQTYTVSGDIDHFTCVGVLAQMPPETRPTPTPEPTEEPTPTVTAEPTQEPTPTPTAEPTQEPPPPTEDEGDDDGLNIWIIIGPIIGVIVVGGLIIWMMRRRTT
ncbi:MAG: hypothetical protein R6U37_02825 [Dehalococcoidia bacterium]